MNIVFIWQCKKRQPNCPENSRNKCSSNSFQIVFCQIQAILLPFLTVCSTSIRYQEIVVCILDK